VFLLSFISDYLWKVKEIKGQTYLRHQKEGERERVYATRERGKEQAFPAGIN